MNGKRAKLLRSLAGVNKQNHNSRHYEGIQHTLRNHQHKVYHPDLTDTNGKRVVTGTITSQTVTLRMSQGARVLYKMMKKQFKAKQGIFASAL